MQQEFRNPAFFIQRLQKGYRPPGGRARPARRPSPRSARANRPRTTQQDENPSRVKNFWINGYKVTRVGRPTRGAHAALTLYSSPRS